MKKLKICVLGGTGFVGSHLCTELVKRGYAVKILTRRRERHRELLVLPTLEIVESDIYDESQLNQHFQDSLAVINLVGILNETGHDGSGFHTAHVELARRVITQCSLCKVPRLLHMSALNANPAAKSHYLRSKGEAENYVHTFAKDTVAVTTFRPSVIFGPEDSFMNRFAELLKITPLILPLACANTKFAPVYVGDVVAHMVNALLDRESHNKRINLCGPKQYTLKELVQFVSDMCKCRVKVIGLPDRLSKLQAYILEYFPGKPFSIDNYYSLQTDSVCPESDSCATTLESIAPNYLVRKSKHPKLKETKIDQEQD